MRRPDSSQQRNNFEGRSNGAAGPTLVSIVIISYNYAEFVSRAIDSALDQTYAPIEVIVIDDGSTDGSQSIITTFGNRIRSSFQAWGGETSANNAGFEISTGDVVMFLDSDDVLHRSAVEEVMARWRPGVAKIQFRLATVNREGEPIGNVIPAAAALSPEKVRQSVLMTGLYAWPPTSGNAYSRWFLQRVMPLPTADFPSAPDGIINAVAPLYGAVISIDKVLGNYRIHGRNAFSTLRLEPERIAGELEMRKKEMRYFIFRAAEHGITFDDDLLDGVLFLERRLALLRLAPTSAWSGDTKRGLLRRAVRNLTSAPGSIVSRVVLLVWFFVFALAPRQLAYKLSELRLVPAARPARLVDALRWLGVFQHGLRGQPRQL